MNDQSADKPLAGPNLDARLTPVERAFRKILLDLLIGTGRPLLPEEAAAAADLSQREGGRLLEAIRAKGLLVRTGSGEIAFVYPVSALPTPHRVTLADGRAFYAMCAMDALGSAYEFDRDATISSSCSHCRRPLTVSLAGGELAVADPPTIQVLHVDLDRYGDWAANC